MANSGNGTPDTGHIIDALHEVRDSMIAIGTELGRLADSISAQTSEEAVLTREHIGRLDDKVHVLSVLARVLITIVVVQAVGLGWVIWNQNKNAENFSRLLEANTAQLHESSGSTHQLLDLLDPRTDGSRRANAQFDDKLRTFFAQQECDMGGYCEPGMSPQHPLQVPTTTMTTTTAKP